MAGSNSMYMYIAMSCECSYTIDVSIGWGPERVGFDRGSLIPALDKIPLLLPIRVMHVEGHSVWWR